MDSYILDVHIPLYWKYRFLYIGFIDSLYRMYRFLNIVCIFSSILDV